MLGFITILAETGMPEVPGLALEAPRRAASHIPPVFAGLAVFALALVGYLVWDLWRQKRDERRRQIAASPREG